MNNNEFDKFARIHQGISSTTLSCYPSVVDAYTNSSFIVEHSSQPYAKAAVYGERNF